MQTQQQNKRTAHSVKRSRYI